MTIPAPRPDRTALVTGASSGIGAEIARKLAARGHGLTLVARREDRLRSLAHQLSSAHDVRVEVIPTDLADEGSRSALVAEVVARGLEVNVLVNNAGLTTMGPASRGDVTGDLAMVRTDVEAVVHLCTAILPGMVERRSGAILNVASTAAFQPVPGQAGYAASKAFVLSYSHAVRAELRGSGITVTALCPGPVETGFADAAGLSDAEAAASLPKVMWLPAERVAAAGVAGLDADRAVVIPGAANKVGAAGGWLTPRRLMLPMMAKRHPALKS
jgi:short-subunit dehydrogenase